MTNSRKASGSVKRKTEGLVEVLDVVEAKSGLEYIKFSNNPNIEILINGVKVNGKAVFLNNPAAKYEKFVKAGHMTQEEADVAIDKIPSFVIETGTINLSQE